ncbi:MAG: outer membrane receptor for ferrienterochelin and colicins [Crocinitomix sp.]|jgi:outer membrane receptor for ferrienterochelin and colicins
MRLILIFILISVSNLYAQVAIQLIDRESKAEIVNAKMKINGQKGEQYYLSNKEGFIFTSDSISGEISYEITAIGFDTLIGIIDPKRTSNPLILSLIPNRLFDAVIITAQYEPTMVNNAIQKATIISKDQIEQSGAVNLGDILTYQTGIRLSQDNILGSSMSLGGLSGQNVKILIDGVPVIGRQDGSIDLSQINLSNIERIEIIEGPLSVNYGTNALAGTINLITKKEQNKGISISVNPYYESIGNFNLTGTIGLKVKKHNITLSGGRNFFDGWSDTDDFFQFPKSRLADTNRFKTWKPKEQYFFDARYTTQIKGWTFSPFVRYFDEIIVNRGLPLAPYNQFGLDDYYHTIRKDIGFNLNRNFKKGKFNTIFAYNQFERNKNTYVKDLTNLEQSLSEAFGAQDTALFTLLNIRSSYIHQFGKKLGLETGIDVNYETAYGKRIDGLEKDQGDYAGYLTAEWKPFKNVQLKPGLRYAYNTNYDAPLTPSINILYKLKKFRFRGAFARGFRAPTLKELYFDFVDINHNIQGNTELKSEYSYNYSGGITWVKNLNNRQLVQVDYKVFYNDIENLITLGALPDGSFTYINLGEFKSIGNQLKFSLKSQRLTSTLATSYIGRLNQLSSENNDVKKYAYSPEASLNCSYELIKDKLQLSAFYKFNGALQSYGLVDDKIRKNEQSSYSILDCSLSTQLLKKKLRLTVGAKNILNVKTVNVIGTTGGSHTGTGNFNAARGTSIFFSAKYTINYDFKNK